MRTCLVVEACLLGIALAAPTALAQESAWAQHLGGSGSVPALGAGLGNAGDLDAAGRFAGTADVDPGPSTYDLTSPGDSSAFISKPSELAVPPEVGRITFSDKSLLVWLPVLGAYTYNVYRSDSPLPGSFACFNYLIRNTAVTDAQSPQSGHIWDYLVTARSADDQEGTMGFQGVHGAPATERPNTAPCP